MTATLITGIPRSGTTLVCACLNTLPDCVALVEPINNPMHGDVNRAVIEIVNFAAATRARLLAEHVAPSKTVNGVIADNLFEEVRTDGGTRRDLGRLGEVNLDKPLTRNFRLFIKHTAIFTVLAQPLATRLPIYAILRHPLACLASWQTVDFPLRRGRWPVCEAFAPDLREQLDRIGKPLQRQIAILRWIFLAYRGLPRQHVVHYESIVRDPGAAIAPLSGATAPLTYPVHAVDLRTRYPGIDLAELAKALLALEAEVEPFYPDFVASLRPYIRDI